MKAKVLAKKLVFQNRWIKVYEKHVQIGDNPPHNHYVVGEHKGIAAVLAIDENDNIILVRQFRWSVEKYLLDIPGGGVDQDEDAEVAARRELREETGYTADHLELLMSRYLDSGQKDAIQYIYIAKGLHKGKTDMDSTESITVIKRAFKQVSEDVIKGKYLESTLIIAVLLEMERRLANS
jgi:ADP-ribose pyrophosphatase